MLTTWTVNFKGFKIQKIKDVKWEYLVLSIVVLFKLYVIALGLILDPAGFDLLAHLKHVGGFFDIIILISIVLVSFKIIKSYLALAILSALALLAHAAIELSLYDYLNLNKEIGENIIYKHGAPTFLGWLLIVFDPFFFTSLASLYLYKKVLRPKNSPVNITIPQHLCAPRQFQVQ